MPFKDAACHVWAIDGYENDARSARANHAFTSTADEMVPPDTTTRPKRQKSDPNAVVKSIVLKVRRKLGTELVPNQECIVYGGCRGSNQIPEHWWIEVGTRIYDTMPDYNLYSVPATDKTRRQPFLEREAFDPHRVGRFDTYLTLSQQVYISNHDQLAAPHLGTIHTVRFVDSQDSVEEDPQNAVGEPIVRAII